MIRSSVTSVPALISTKHLCQGFQMAFAFKDSHWHTGNLICRIVLFLFSVRSDFRLSGSFLEYMLENRKFFFLVRFHWGLGEVFDALILRGDGRLRKVKHKRLPHKRKDREQTNQLLKMLNCKTATGDWLSKGRVQKMKSMVFCQTPLRLKKIPTFFWGESKTTNGWNKFDTWSHFQKK